MVKGKNIIIIIIISLIILVGHIFFVIHSPKLELIEKIEYLNQPIDYNVKYFFVKDEDYNGFYNGVEVFRCFDSEYDSSNFDTKKYTYIVSVNREIESIKYSGLKCKRRKLFFFPDEYQADVVCSENKNDATLRIYRMKKINIDYDYHGTEFLND